ncbi:MAG: BatD family protein [Candidatus Tenebribacter mawsonii]|nr:BatD family protein [Candidatus Tenebribacter mawsonii]
MKKIIILLGLCLFAQILFSQSLTIESYVDKTKIGVSDLLKFTIEISGEKVGNIATPRLPKIKNFENLGSSTSSSSNYSIVNGKMTSEVTKSFTYSFRPNKTGNHLIPPITLKIKDKTYTTDPIHIKVLEGSTQPAPPTSPSFTQQPDSSVDLSDNLFLKANISKTKVFEEEPVIVEYKLYSRYDISNLAFAGDTNFEGFWKEDIYKPESINFERETYNGIMYNVMLIRSVALFPTKSGTLKIPSVTLNVDVRTQSHSFFDFGTTKRYNIKNDPISVQVNPIPTTNKPVSYSNAVGKFKLTSNVSETNLNVGDSFTYTITISGTGNLKQFDIPQLKEVSNLRFLDPEIATDINKNKISGKKTIKYLIIAQEKGNYSLPEVPFTYFDTSSRNFKTIRTKPFQLSVGEGDLTFVASSSAQSIVSMEGSDIGFIITDSDLTSNINYYDKFLYWFIWFIILLFIPASIYYSKEQTKLAGNIDYIRQKQANKILKKYMKEANIFAAKEDPGFYAAAQQGLSSYLADKLKEPRGSSTEEIISKMISVNVPNMLVERIKTLFETCDQARFMPGGFSKEKIEADYTLMKETITEIMKCKF